MAMNRRELLTSLGTAAAAATLRRDLGAEPAPTDGPARFPRKTDFAFEKGWTYISGAYTHPMPIAAADAYREVVTRRGTVGAPPPPTASSRVVRAPRSPRSSTRCRRRSAISRTRAPARTSSSNASASRNSMATW